METVFNTVSCLQTQSRMVYDLVQYHSDFVGWSPSQNSIIVAHEGTDPTAL